MVDSLSPAKRGIGTALRNTKVPPIPVGYGGLSCWAGHCPARSGSGPELPLEPVPDRRGDGHARHRPEERAEHHPGPARPEGEHGQDEADRHHEPPEGGRDDAEEGQHGLKMTTHSVAFLPLRGDVTSRSVMPKSHQYLSAMVG
jgi:hypothetical protein